MSNLINPITLSLLTMPIDHSGSHWVPGTFQNHAISCMTAQPFSCAWGSSHFTGIPYLSPFNIGTHMGDLSSNRWYQGPGEDLYFCDFVFQLQIRTAHYLSQCVDCFPTHDQVLECLLVEGTFNCDDIHSESALCHQYTAALCQQLLMHVERLKEQVGLNWFCHCSCY
jgi:hypothetical protein